jgi:hypothetical protein
MNTDDYWDELGLPRPHPVTCSCDDCIVMDARQRRREACTHEFGAREETWLGIVETCKKCGQMQGRASEKEREGQ